MSSTPSASPVIEMSAIVSEPERSPLEQLIDRARAASDRMAGKNPHRILLQEMAIGLVSQATLIARMTEHVSTLQAQIADKPRIIVP